MPFEFGAVTVCTIKFWSSKCFGPIKLELVIGLCLSNLEFISCQYLQCWISDGFWAFEIGFESGLCL